MGRLILYALFSCLLFCSFPRNASGQEFDSVIFDGHEPRDFYIGLSSTVVGYPAIATRMGIGLDFEHLVSSHAGFGCLIAGGPNYAEVSASVIALLAWSILEMEDPREPWLYFLLPLVFENPRFHLNPIRNTEINFSLNLLKYRYIWRPQIENTEDVHYFSGSLGMGFSNFFHQRWCVNYFGELSTLYTHGRPIGFQFGVIVKHRINSR